MRIVAVDWEDRDDLDYVVAQGTTIVRAFTEESFKKQMDKLEEEHTYCKVREANKYEIYNG